MATYVGHDGTVLHHDRVGRDDHAPAILLAGGACRHPAYLGDLAGLGDVQPLVIPHLRGVGRSPAPDDPAAGSAWAQTADVDALQDHLDLATVTVMGHSAGTRLALAYAARLPDRVERLVLITPPAGVIGMTADLDHRFEARTTTTPAVAAALAAREAGPDLSDDESFTAWQVAIAPLTYAAWGPTEEAHARVGGYVMEAARRYMADLGPHDLLDRVRATGVPITMVVGDEDGSSGRAPMAALAARLGAESRMVAASGHYPWVEQPDAFRRAVDPLMVRSPRSSGRASGL